MKTNIMIKTKFFLGSSCFKIQTELNEFLTSEKAEYVDIKFGTGLGQMVCVLVYTEKDINYTHCCTELKDKESIDFENWKLVEKVKCAYGKYFIGNKEFSYKQLIKEYTSYKRSLN
jgi:hypothetical protein